MLFIIMLAFSPDRFLIENNSHFFSSLISVCFLMISYEKNINNYGNWETVKNL